MTIRYLNSPTGTRAFAKLLAQKLLEKRSRQRGALILALTGDLGSGKTTFTQGFLRRLGIKRKITSPTFVLVKRYKVYDLRFKNAYHVDCYRIKKSSEFTKLGLKEILKSSQNIILIEWAEKVKRVLPKNSIWIKFTHGKKENQRTIRIFV